MNTYQPNKACHCPRCRMRNLFGAAMVITVGMLFLLNNFDIVYFDRSWPILIIVVGLFTFASHNAPIEGHIQPYWAVGGATPVAVPPQQDPQVKP